MMDVNNKIKTVKFSSHIISHSPKLTCPFRMLSSLGGQKLSLLPVSIPPSSSIRILLNRFCVAPLLLLLPLLLPLTPESVPFFAPPAPFLGRSGMVMDTDDDSSGLAGTGAGSRGRLRDILPVGDGSSCCITTAGDASFAAIVTLSPCSKFCETTT